MTDSTDRRSHQDDHVPDHPRVRAALHCPVCHNAKDVGLLLCWTCYRSTNARQGLHPSIAAIITNAEQDAGKEQPTT